MIEGLKLGETKVITDKEHKTLIMRVHGGYIYSSYIRVTRSRYDPNIKSQANYFEYTGIGSTFVPATTFNEGYS